MSSPKSKYDVSVGLEFELMQVVESSRKQTRVKITVGKVILLMIIVVIATVASGTDYLSMFLR